jgi:HTH-type transcriptional repressor of NAD biosynthesis genes
MPRFDHALVVGKFAPPHRGHQFLFDAALEAAERLTIVVGSNPDFPDMPSAARAAWIAELYADATVIVADDGGPNDAPGRGAPRSLARRPRFRTAISASGSRVAQAEPSGRYVWN